MKRRFNVDIIFDLEKEIEKLSIKIDILNLEKNELTDKYIQRDKFLSSELDNAWEAVKKKEEEINILRSREQFLSNELDKAWFVVKEKEEQRSELIARDKFLSSELDNSHKAVQNREEQISFLKYRINELDDLHENLVSRYWNNCNESMKYACIQPFEKIDILPRGEVYTCCSVYLKHNYYIGNIFEQDFNEIWNSERAKRLRYSVSKGNFEYCTEKCKWLHCKDINIEVAGLEINPILPRKVFEDNINNENNYGNLPKFIALSCDETCNLTCRSCRTGFKGLNKEDGNKLYDTLMSKVRPILNQCKLLTGLGSGEIFASKAVSDFFKTITHDEFPNLNIAFVTNAQLFTEEKWSEFSNLKNIPLRVYVSIDAFNKETYELLRRGGVWEILCNNMNFISKLRKCGEVSYLSLQFVVQKENYAQINDFILLAKNWSADTVELQRLTNWGSYSEQEYMEKDVFNPDNSSYDEAKSMIENIIKNKHDINIIENIV